MKNKLSLLVVISFLLIGNLNAQHQKNRFAISAKFNRIDNVTPLDKFTLFNSDNFSESTEGGEVSFLRNINKFMNIGLPIRMGKANVREDSNDLDDIQRKLNISADLVAQFGYFKADYFITPYIMGGVGYQLETVTNENNNAIAFPVGAGLNVRLFPNVYLQVQTEYRFASLDNRDQIIYGAGLMVPFRGITDEPKDKDKDGVPDKEDECPLLAGPLGLKGCPDADGDAVPDKDDKCPAETGLAKFSGCPDTDDDGVMDKEDECPTEPGLIELKGCPVQDADGDGVPDQTDKCPEEAGPASNEGCPAKDADNDGVDDRVDRCPNEAGPASNGGCPEVKDSDNDGINDKDDRCPNSAGTIENNGCPEIKVEDKEILNLAVSNIEFQTSRATLKTSSFTVLDQILMLMQKYPDHNLSINGHTDSVGSSKTNQVLSERRAKSCYDYLVNKGISPSRLNYTGYGESQPIADNRFKDGREKNRRVEFDLYVK